MRATGAHVHAHVAVNVADYQMITLCCTQHWNVSLLHIKEADTLVLPQTVHITGFVIWSCNRCIITHTPPVWLMAAQVFISYFIRMVWLRRSPDHLSFWESSIIFGAIWSLSRDRFGTDVDFLCLLCHYVSSVGTKSFVRRERWRFQFSVQTWTWSPFYHRERIISLSTERAQCSFRRRNSNSEL